MPSKSKTKGNSWERELCKYLSSVFGGSFTRVPNSGAFTGGKNAFRKQSLSETQVILSKGDIIPPDHMPKLVLEAKFYAEFRFHQLLQPGPVPQLDEWIKQALDAVDDGDFWLIAFKINLRGLFVAVPESLSTGMVFGNHARYTGDKGTFVICDLKSFFDANKDVVAKLSS